MSLMFLIFILVANLCIHAAKGYTVLQIEIIINLCIPIPKIL